MIVVWRVTTRCNLACPFCAYDRRLLFARHEADADEIRALCAALADYQRLRDDPVLVSWLGGEPFLRADLPALSAHATGLGLRVSATTNGTTLGSAAVRRHLLDHYSELTVSLDAAGPAHDDFRSWPGAFAALRQNVSALAAARRAEGRALKLRVNAVLMRSTLPAFATLAREIASWGVDELTFNALGGRDRPEFFTANCPTPEQLTAFAIELPALRAALAEAGLTITGTPGYLARLHAAARGEPQPVAECGPGEQFLFINEPGRVSPCSFTADDLGIPIRDLSDAAAIAALPGRFARARFAARPAICNDCPSTQVFAKFAPALP